MEESRLVIKIFPHVGSQVKMEIVSQAAIVQIISIEAAYQVVKLGESHFENYWSCNEIILSKSETKVKVTSEIEMSACSIVFVEHIFRKYFCQIQLKEVVDKSFSAVVNGTSCIIVGKINVLVNNQFELEATIAKVDSNSHPFPLLNRTWLDVISHSCRQYFQDILVPESHCYNSVTSQNSFIKMSLELNRKYSSVFESNNHPIKDIKVHLELRKDSNPKFIMSAELPYAFRNQVEGILKNLESRGILKPVKFFKLDIGNNSCEEGK